MDYNSTSYFSKQAITSCWAATTSCTCPNVLTGIIDLVVTLKNALAPLINILPLGLNVLVNGLLDFLVMILNGIGNSLNEDVLPGLADLVDGILAGLQNVV